MLEMTFHIGQERDLIPTDKIGRVSQNSVPYDGKPNFQGRQGDINDVVILHLRYANDDSPVNLAGTNIILEGVLPDKEHCVVSNTIMTIIGSPEEGNARIQLPAAAFAVAGQYVTSFFRLERDYQSVATLEFEFSVIADPVLNGVKVGDYLPEYYKIYNKIVALQDELKNSTDKQINDMDQQFQNKIAEWSKEYSVLLSTSQSLQTQMSALEGTIKSNNDELEADVDAMRTNVKSTLASMNQEIDTLEAQIKSDQIVTISTVQKYIVPNIYVGTLHLTDQSISHPTVRAFIYQYGAGITGNVAGGSALRDVECRVVRDHQSTVAVYVSADEISSIFPEFKFSNPSCGYGWNGAYLASGINCLGIEVEHATVAGFDVNDAIKIGE